MKIISNEKLIKRNKKIGQYTTFVALAVLGIGLYFSFAQPEKISVTFGALLVGFLLTQVGVFYGNRWGRSPRPDELVTASLKGLGETYSLYHYTAGIPHLLAGPTGLWAVIPNSAAGKISFDESKGRFRQKGGSIYMKIFGQDSVGRPESDAQYTISDLKKWINKKASDINLPEPKAVVVFLNAKAEVDAQNAPIPAMHVEKLKDFIRKQPKGSIEDAEAIKALQKALPTETTSE